MDGDDDGGDDGGVDGCDEGMDGGVLNEDTTADGDVCGDGVNGIMVVVTAWLVAVAMGVQVVMV